MGLDVGLGWWGHTVCDDDGIIALDGFVGHGAGEVDGEEDRVHLAAERVEGGFEED